MRRVPVDNGCRDDGCRDDGCRDDGSDDPRSCGQRGSGCIVPGRAPMLVAGKGHRPHRPGVEAAHSAAPVPRRGHVPIWITVRPRAARAARRRGATAVARSGSAAPRGVAGPAGDRRRRHRGGVHDRRRSSGRGRRGHRRRLAGHPRPRPRGDAHRRRPGEGRRPPGGCRGVCRRPRGPIWAARQGRPRGGVPARGRPRRGGRRRRCAVGHHPRGAAARPAGPRAG